MRDHFPDAAHRELLQLVEVATTTWVLPSAGSIQERRTYVPTSSFRISRVPCRSVDGSVIPDNVVRQELLRMDCLKGVTLTRVSWFLPRSEIDRQQLPTCNLGFSVADKDGSLRERISKAPASYLFGARRKVQENKLRPTLTQCTSCAALGHLSKGCKGAHRCFVCARAHHTNQHRARCTFCLSEGNQSPDCPHPLLCALCGGGHRADDASCVRRRKYAPPKDARETSSVPGGPNPGSRRLPTQTPGAESSRAAMASSCEGGRPPSRVSFTFSTSIGETNSEVASHTGLTDKTMDMDMSVAGDQ